MSINEYKTLLDEEMKRCINEYLTTKYTKNYYLIPCLFSTYKLDEFKHKCIWQDVVITSIKREEYASLLLILLKRPSTSFVELPKYTSIVLYKNLLSQISKTSIMFSDENPSIPLSSFAVGMTSLEKDVRGITGDSPHSFRLPFNEYLSSIDDVFVKCMLNRIEIEIHSVVGRRKMKYIYGMIDIESVKKILRVKTNKGIENALCRIGKGTSRGNSDVFWIARWLYNHNIPYVQAYGTLGRSKKNTLMI